MKIIHANKVCEKLLEYSKQKAFEDAKNEFKEIEENNKAKQKLFKQLAKEFNHYLKTDKYAALNQEYTFNMRWFHSNIFSFMTCDVSRTADLIQYLNDTFSPYGYSFDPEGVIVCNMLRITPSITIKYKINVIDYSND